MTTNLTPGTPVWHPDHEHGIVAISTDGYERIYYAGRDVGLRSAPSDESTDWERVETVRPGEVAVRVDDIADRLVEIWGPLTSEWGASTAEIVAIRAAKAIKAQRDQATPQATLQPDSNKSDSGETLPTETTVRHLGAHVGLFRHPDVPGHLAHSELMDGWRREGCSTRMTHHFVLDHGDHCETVCPDGTVTAQPRDTPAIPDEPTEPGARWTLDGKRCVRDADPKGFPAWLDVDSVGNWHSWDGATSHVEGWGETP